MKLVILGSGASTGVPMIGCHCEVCGSSDLANKRLRPSALICHGTKKIVIDIGPDFRMQALLYGIDFLDAVLLTHAHFDHVAGLDELRAYSLIYKNGIPVYCSRYTLELLKKRYEYLFKERIADQVICAQLEFFPFSELEGEIEIEGIKIRYVNYEQEGMQVNGFRINDLAYICDIRSYSEEIFSQLSGVKTLIVGALRKTSSFMHFSFEQAINFGQKIGAKQIYLTHLSHEVSNKMQQELPEGVMLAYDGLTLEL